MMYTEEQVRVARANLDKRRDCPEWLQKMFMMAPSHQTLSKCHKSWSPNFAGDSSDMIYRVSDEWPPKDMILPDGVKQLTDPVEMLVSDDGDHWFRAFVIGHFDGSFLVLTSQSNHEWWKHAKKVPETKKFTVELVIADPPPVINESTVRTAIEDVIHDYYSTKSDVTVKEVS